MDALVFLLVIAGILAALYICGLVGEHRNRRSCIEGIAASYGKKSGYRFTNRERDHIKSYLVHHRCDGQIDDITWNDLQMDLVFEQMNFTGSRIGSEYLYYLLRTPDTGGDIAGKEEYYMQHEDERDSLMLQFHDFGKCNGSPIYDFLDLLDTDRHFSKTPYIVMDIALALSVVFMVFVPSWGLLVFLGVIIMNMIMYFSKKHEADPYLNGFAYTIRMLKAAECISGGKDRIKRDKCAFKDEISELGSICDSMRSFSSGSFLLMSSSSSNPFDIVLDYIRMILGIDMIKFGQMLDMAKRSKDDIDRLSSVLGYMDSVLSVSFYRASLNGRYCIPEFTEYHHGGRPAMEITDVYDPLIKKPVCNSISTSKSVLITGSNASGKSTFLKTVSLCALMAETIGICTAASYKAPYFRILSAMSTMDDITTGNSYYIAEIKAIHRMIDEVKKDDEVPVICFIDEILRGTNTVERIAASAQILRFFGESGSLCFAATHDIELTSMLDGIYENYHFKEEIKDGVITFPYKIFEGKARSRNAIKLLDAMGYEKDIVDAAERSAEDFISKGEWHI